MNRMMLPLLLLQAYAISGAFAAPTEDDRRFVAGASKANAGEIATAQLAASHSSSADIQAYAQHIIADHTDAGVKLRNAASSEGLAVPHDEQPPVPADLQQLEGDAFDRAFARRMVEDHEKAVALFKQKADSSKGTAIDRFATETLPTLETHLKMARALPTGPEAAAARKP